VIPPFALCTLTASEEKSEDLFRDSLVDDNEDIREIFQEGLEKRGFEVVPSANVSEALKLIVNEHFDVLLSDLHMPDPGDGFTVVSAMRHTHPMAVTVVMMTCPSFCTSSSERVYITAMGCEIEFGGARELQAAGAGGL
jgi:DNA-binding response OmpR family regulator